jgi:hypothetical protein
MRILSAEGLDASQYRAAVSLLCEYLDWVLTLESFAREAPAFARESQERSEIPAEYSLPSGRFLCAFRAGDALGCIALSRHDDRTPTHIRATFVKQWCAWNDRSRREREYHWRLTTISPSMRLSDKDAPPVPLLSK